jgi:TonB family protein
VPARTQAQNELASLRNMFEKSNDLSNIKSAGMPGFVLRGDVLVWTKKDAASHGKFLFVWSPEGEWREEIAFADYKRSRVGDGTQLWQVRSTEVENPSIFELQKLLDGSRAPKIEGTDRLDKGWVESIENIGAQCIKRGISSFVSSYCFDAGTGDLLRVSAAKDSTEVPWMIRRQEYTNFQTWAQKRVARTLRGYNGKRMVLEVELEEIKPLPQLPPDYFVPQKDATLLSYCAEGAAWKVKERVAPTYPQSARAQHHQGTVVLDAIIGEDGHVSDLRIIHSAGADLDRSAMAAVSQWRYERTSACPLSKGRTETNVDVIYSLNF